MISAIVPIKKESQRVPNKNFKMINGKPLFFWIISSLNASNYIDEIVINCDESFVEEKNIFDRFGLAKTDPIR